MSVEPVVQPTTLPEGWTVFLNSSRQVVYSHVKTGMLCFQIPENPEVLNNLVLKAVPKQVTICTPVCWTDPLCLRKDRRRPKMTTTTENSPSKDVKELKQAALWHGDRQYINQANDASVEAIMTLLRWS